MDSAVTYAWRGHNGIYIGKANQRRQRRPTFSGVCTRWFEHECLRYKKHLPGAEFYRYVVARKAAASARSFMIIRQGSCESMLLYQSLIIRMLSPNMNACRDNGRAGQEHHHPSPRRRPPRSSRDGCLGRSIACKGPSGQWMAHCVLSKRRQQSRNGSVLLLSSNVAERCSRRTRSRNPRSQCQLGSGRTNEPGPQRNSGPLTLSVYDT